MLLFSLVSCNKDLSEEIVDTWYLRTISVNTISIEVNDCMKKSSWTFKEGGSLEAINYDGESNDKDCDSSKEFGTWKMNDDETKLTIDDGDGPELLDFSIEKDELEITGSIEGEKVSMTFER
jgi:hypothetical protein